MWRGENILSSLRGGEARRVVDRDKAETALSSFVKTPSASLSLEPFDVDGFWDGAGGRGMQTMRSPSDENV